MGRRTAQLQPSLPFADGLDFLFPDRLCYPSLPLLSPPPSIPTYLYLPALLSTTARTQSETSRAASRVASRSERLGLGA